MSRSSLYLNGHSYLRIFFSLFKGGNGMQKGPPSFDGEFLYHFVPWTYDNSVICHLVNKAPLCHVKCMYTRLHSSFEQEC